MLDENTQRSRPLPWQPLGFAFAEYDVVERWKVILSGGARNGRAVGALGGAPGYSRKMENGSSPGKVGWRHM